MSNRRQGRELAVQFLFQREFAGDTALDAALENFWHSLDEPPAADARAFAEELIRGTLAQQTEIDARIQKCAAHWDLPRIAAVDRAILRLAIFEMLGRDDIPPVVSINEAVDLAKKFSTTESGKFVNGILDRIRKELPRPARKAQ